MKIKKRKTITLNLNTEVHYRVQKKKIGWDGLFVPPLSLKSQNLYLIRKYFGNDSTISATWYGVTI